MKIREYTFTQEDIEIQAQEEDSWQFRAGFIYPVVEEEDSNELKVYFHLLQSDGSLHQRVLVIEKQEWAAWVDAEPAIHVIPASDMNAFLTKY
ncbi:hypothetical protein LFYK43_08510 [Ligilactobacillus salitolerans]|uniref:Uncharacterized protein n=1 Tax=Ligilactobacillus salitolerans TaxID=1808352 RepID=A0A401IS80_9LACO|nr:hypothetical protein [Ligilactobacillus salitolerans]GBG94392.1 hypothetical protein LFYK43_08510 [Ligilactobacillus salitolerans]